MKMWEKPWKMAEGFVLGACLVAVGLLLQLCIGPVAWDTFAWPVNGMVLAAFVLLIVATHLCRRRIYICRYIATLQAAVPTLVYAVALTIVMGLTRQDGESGWLSDMLTFWSFVLLYMLVAFILGVATLKRCSQMAEQIRNEDSSQGHRWLSDVAFLLNHTGLFLALVCATLGNADVQRLKMVTSIHSQQWRAVNSQMFVVEVPIGVELKRFIMETYDDGSPRRYASEIEIVTRTGKELQATVDVNHPVKVEGWKIYQFGYDTELGAESQTSILELVRDPWQPAVYTGIFMMLGGALFLFFGRKRKEVAS